jgi:hypothetical protein
MYLGADFSVNHRQEGADDRHPSRYPVRYTRRTNHMKRISLARYRKRRC